MQALTYTAPGRFELTDNRGADRVIEVAGGDDTLSMAWQCVPAPTA